MLTLSKIETRMSTKVNEMFILIIEGCAFIYVDPSVSDALIEKYHNKYKCEGVRNPGRLCFLDG